MKAISPVEKNVAGLMRSENRTPEALLAMEQSIRSSTGRTMVRVLELIDLSALLTSLLFV